MTDQMMGHSCHVRVKRNYRYSPRAEGRPAHANGSAYNQELGLAGTSLTPGVPASPL